MKHKGFTLLELLIVVAIIGILLAIIVPTVNKDMENQNVTETHLVEEPVMFDGSRPHQSNAGTSAPANTGGTQIEQCIDGNVYFTFTSDGIDYKTAKVDSYGYNIRCTE